MIALLRRLLDSKTQHIARLPSKKSQRKEQRPQTKVATWQYIASIAATVLVLCVLLYTVYVYRQRIQLSEGRPSPMHYKAPRDVSVLDPIATERLRQEARNKVRPVYKANPENTKLVEDVVSNGQLPASVKTLVLQRYANTQGVNEVARQSLIEEAVTLEPSRSAEVQTILERDLLATAEEDSTLLQTLRDAAAEAVEPSYQTLQQDETIVREGDIITAEHLRVLKETNLYRPVQGNIINNLIKICASLLMALLLTAILWYAYVWLLARLPWRQSLFLLTLVLTQLMIQRIALLLDEGFLIVSLVPLVFAVILSERAAITLAVWCSLVIALFAPEAGLMILFVNLIASISAILSLRLFANRSSLFFAGSISGVLAAISLLIYSLMAGTFSMASLVTTTWLLAGGVLAGMMALGLVTVAESSLGFVTEFRLLELSNPASPLLERLLIEAPGTYQHSLTIANMVEPAVANIGGDALLARVGALYHDVGKLRRPQFFVENQFSGHNPHDTLSPHLSYLIITSHVRDGIKLLNDYKLPEILDPFVQEHHGTTILAYFYKRALEEDSNVSSTNFRYAGPRPQSKETAVLMIADAVESASRTLADPSQGSVRALIDRIIQQRSQDEQFSESPLNLHDLEEIASSFERTLMAVLHRRIRYPSDDELKNLKSSQSESSSEIRIDLQAVNLKSTLTPSHLPHIATMPNSKQSPSASDLPELPPERAPEEANANDGLENSEDNDEVIVEMDDD